MNASATPTRGGARPGSGRLPSGAGSIRKAAAAHWREAVAVLAAVAKDASAPAAARVDAAKTLLQAAAGGLSL